jgi:hypothetical protein
VAVLGCRVDAEGLVTRGRAGAEVDAEPPADEIDAGEIVAPDAARGSTAVDAAVSATRDAAAPLDATPDVLHLDADAPIPSNQGLDRGLLLWLSFDDSPGATMARDDSGRNNQVSLRGLDPLLAWVPGRIAGAIDLTTAKMGYVRVENAETINLVGGEMTIAAWLWRPQQKAGVIVGRRATNAARSLYRLDVEADGGVRLLLNDRKGVKFELRSFYKLALERWTHVAVTADKAEARIYIDGALAGSAPYGVPLASDVTPLLIGAAESDAAPVTPADFWSGRLDEVVLYERALSAMEIAAFAGGARPPTGPETIR